MFAQFRTVLHGIEVFPAEAASRVHKKLEQRAPSKVSLGAFDWKKFLGILVN
jgi:hypothetical protein